jgi:hypothetical protein
MCFVIPMTALILCQAGENLSLPTQSERMLLEDVPSQTSRNGLRADASQFFSARGVVFVDYRLQWVGGGGLWVLIRPEALLSLTYYDGQDQVVGRGEQVIRLGYYFRSRRTTTSHTLLALTPPPSARFVTVEFSRHVVTRRFPITPVKE